MACTSCFCWSDARRATAIIGLFSALTSALQILITAAVFTGGSALYGTISLSPASLENTVYALYIGLSALDFVVLVLSLVLLCGNERPDEASARCYVIPWLVMMPLYVIYESAINIFYFYNSFNQAFPFTFPLYNGQYSGFQVIPLVYWLIKDILIIYSVGYLISRLYSPLPISAPALNQASPVKNYVASTPNVVNIYAPGPAAPPDSYFSPSPKLEQAYRNGGYLEGGIEIYDRAQYQPVAVPMRRPWYTYARSLLPSVTRYGRNPYY